MADHGDSVEALAVCKSFPLAVSGGIHDKIFVYDLNKYVKRTEIFMGKESGTTKLIFSEKDPNLLWAGSTRGEIRLLNPLAGEVLKTFQGHTEAITDFIEVKNSDLFVSTSDDHKVLIFDIRGGQNGLVEPEDEDEEEANQGGNQ